MAGLGRDGCGIIPVLHSLRTLSRGVECDDDGSNCAVLGACACCCGQAVTGHAVLRRAMLCCGGQAGTSVSEPCHAVPCCAAGKKFPLDQVVEAVTEAQQAARGGKVLLEG